MLNSAMPAVATDISVFAMGRPVWAKRSRPSATAVGTNSDSSRAKLKDLARRPLRLEAAERLASIRQRDKQHTETALRTCDWFTGPIPKLQPTYGQVAREYGEQESRVGDPTTLIVIDEADRLRMASLEQVRAIFDAQEIGLILIGMPGLEKRLARYPQFYSRIGFVHEFRPLGAPEVRQLLEQHWSPAGVKLPQTPLDPETVAVIIRVTGGNFRLLNRDWPGLRLASQTSRAILARHRQIQVSPW